ncbi:MAG: clostripain-related cysteine peptidase, partial [Chloroflexota bacterium]
GIASDDTSGDDLSLNDLRGGISRAMDELNGKRFDFVGFDACLMGQLEIYAALTPFADVAIASQELTPVQGWPYTEWLNSLVDQAEGGNLSPDESAGAETGRQLVDLFLNYYGDIYPSEFVSMAAVDLTQIPAVNDQFDNLLDTLDGDLPQHVDELSQLRAGSETYARAYGINAELYASIDLHHFAQLIHQEISNDEVFKASSDLMASIETAVISAGRGRGLAEAHGIAVHFPDSSAAKNPSYAIEADQIRWNQFLDRYHSAANETNIAPPVIDILSGLAEEAYGIANLPYQSFRIRGIAIEEVALWGGIYIDAGDGTQKRQLLEYDPLIPEPTYNASGQSRFIWQDGIHEDFFIWSTEVTYLTDGTNGQFVVMWPTSRSLNAAESGLNLRTVEGIYTDQTAGKAYQANLVFDQSTQTLQQIWGFANGNEPFEILPRPGDSFQPYNFFLDGFDALVKEAGVALTFDANGNLAYDWRPVPSGSYFLGFSAENNAGRSPITLQDFSVTNPTFEEASTKGYLDPYLGYQFSIPDSWYRPTYRDEILFTTNLDGSISMQLTVFPNSAGADAELLKEETLNQFGAVDILYEEDVVIADQAGKSTAYGYFDQNNEPRTGLFLTFSDDSNGFVIDFDGLQANESSTLAAAALVQESFAFKTNGIGLFPSSWPVIDIDTLSIPQPEDFITEPESNGWQRFRARGDNRIFLAIRQEEVADQSTLETLNRLSDVASAGVSNYEQTPEFNLALGNKIWLKRYFTYQNESGEGIRGFVMVTRDKERFIIAWGEGASENFAQLDTNVFGVMLAETH